MERRPPRAEPSPNQSVAKAMQPEKASTSLRAATPLQPKRLDDYRQRLDNHEATLDEIMKARAELTEALDATAGTLSLLQGARRQQADQMVKSLREELIRVDTTIAAVRQELQHTRQGLRQLGGR